MFRRKKQDDELAAPAALPGDPLSLPDATPKTPLASVASQTSHTAPSQEM
jgi:hypothetical protein